MIQQLIIPTWRPAPLNTLMGHWSHGYRRKKSDRAMIATYSNLLDLKPAKDKRRISITITICEPRLKYVDPDAVWKSLLDGLVHSGLLIDDSPRYCELGTVKQQRGPTTQTQITLEDIT